MNLELLAAKLLAAAKRTPPDERVPYAFEKRMMARLTAVRPVEDWAAWVRAFWCSAGVCASIALLLGFWLLRPIHDSESSFSQDLEQSILAGVDDGESTW